MVESVFRSFSRMADEVLLTGQKDPDDFFENEKSFLFEYHAHIKLATSKADMVCNCRKYVADSVGKFGAHIDMLGQIESIYGNKDYGQQLIKIADGFDHLKKIETRIGTDEELKESDTLRYFSEETQAAKDLLYRRLRLLGNYETMSKNIEQARSHNRDTTRMEVERSEALRKLEDLGCIAKRELIDFEKRRVSGFCKNLFHLSQLEIKQSKSKITLLRSLLSCLNEVPSSSSDMTDYNSNVCTSSSAAAFSTENVDYNGSA